MIYKITDIRIITCNKKEEVIEKGELLFDESGIIQVGNSIQTKNKDLIEIKGTGMTILPGLIDSHVHLGMDCSPDPFANMKDESAPEISFRAVKQGYQFLSAGITSVRNLGTRYNVDITYREAIKNNLIIGPHVFASGCPIVMTGGHGHIMAIEADGTDEVRKAARKQLKHGADLLKVMATGGVLTDGNNPGATQLTQEEISCVCQEANQVSKTVAAHTIGAEGIKNAIRAGVTTIEHAYLLDEEAVELMIENKTYLVPTLMAPQLILNNFRKVSQRMIDDIRGIIDNHKTSFQLAHKAGIPIAAGTDAGTPFNEPGLIVEEMKLMKKYGMSNYEVIKSATIVAANVVNNSNKTGSIEKGKIGDLVIVNGNPLEDIEILKEPKFVFLNGSIVDKND